MQLPRKMPYAVPILFSVTNITKLNCDFKILFCSTLIVARIFGMCKHQKTPKGTLLLFRDNVAEKGKIPKSGCFLGMKSQNLGVFWDFA